MTIDAVWLGGPPGNRGNIMRKRLARYGINFVAVHEYLASRDKFPQGTKVVLLNVEMASHGMQDLGKKEADRVGATFVTAGFDLSRTVNNLTRLGIIDSNAPPPEPEPETSEQPTEDDMSNAPQNAQNGSQAPNTAYVAVDHGSIEAQAADALLSIEKWPALRPFLLRGIVEALSKEAGMDHKK
jgi:hypothetical protein